MVSEFATQLWGRIPFPPLIRPLLIRMFLSTTSGHTGYAGYFFPAYGHNCYAGYLNYNIWSHWQSRILFTPTSGHTVYGGYFLLQHMVTLAGDEGN